MTVVYRFIAWIREQRVVCGVSRSSRRRVWYAYTWRNDLLFCVNSPSTVTLVAPPPVCSRRCAKVAWWEKGKGRGPAILPFLLFLRCCRVPSASSFSSRRSVDCAAQPAWARFSARMPAALRVPPAAGAAGTLELQSQQVRPARLVLLADSGLWPPFLPVAH